MPKSNVKKPYAIKSIYKKIPKGKNNYLIIYKELHTIRENFYYIKTVNNLNSFLYNNKKRKPLLFRYYVLHHDETFKFSILDHCRHRFGDYLYEIDNIERVYPLITENIECDSIQPELNMRLNPSIRCDCKFLPDCIVELHDHLLCCPTYEYTLFGEEIPKEVIKAMKNTKKDYEIMKKETRQMEKIDKRIHYRYFESTLSEISKRVCYDVREKNYILPDDKAFVYIGESRHWKNWGESYYKIGKVSSKGLIKSRLVQYNTGRIMGMDDFYFLYLFSVENNDEALKLEKEIKKNFRDYQIKSSEIYKGLSLEELKNFII